MMMRKEKTNLITIITTTTYQRRILRYGFSAPSVLWHGRRALVSPTPQLSRGYGCSPAGIRKQKTLRLSSPRPAASIIIRRVSRPFPSLSTTTAHDPGSAITRRSCSCFCSRGDHRRICRSHHTETRTFNDSSADYYSCVNYDQLQPRHVHRQ